MQEELLLMKAEMVRLRQEAVLSFEEEKNKLENELSERQRDQEEELKVEHEMKQAELIIREKELEVAAETRIANVSAQRERELEAALAELELSLTATMNEKFRVQLEKDRQSRQDKKKALMSELVALKSRLASLGEVESLRKQDIEDELVRFEADGKLQVQELIRAEIAQRRQEIGVERTSLLSELDLLKARLTDLDETEQRRKAELEVQLERCNYC